MMNKREYNTFEELYLEIKPTIQKLNNNYKILNLKENNFILLCEDLLREIYEFNSTLSKVEYLELLQRGLNEYMINRYIANRISILNTTEANLKTLRNLDNFLTAHNIESTPDQYEQLLKNDIISKILAKIVNDNLNIIKTKGIESLEHNQNVILLIEMYCENHNINTQTHSENIFKNALEETNDCQYLSSLGLYLNQISKTLLTKEEEQRLFELKEKGDETAVTKIAEHNLLLVVSIAKHYVGRGLDVLDLIQEGNLGLMTAINKFDYRKGYKLSTYATWWIKQAIQRSIMNSTRIIRLPVHIHEKVIKYAEVLSALEKELGRAPTKTEICEKMHITEEQLRELEKASQSVVSINTQVGDEYDSDTELGDLIAADDEPVDEQFIKSTLSDELLHILEKINLTPRERYVLLQRFGFEDNKPKTLEEIAKTLNLTRERIRQIEAKAMRKIRISPYLQRLANISSVSYDNSKYLQGPTRKKQIY